MSVVVDSSTPVKRPLVHKHIVPHASNAVSSKEFYDLLEPVEGLPDIEDDLKSISKENFVDVANRISSRISTKYSPKDLLTFYDRHSLRYPLDQPPGTNWLPDLIATMRSCYDGAEKTSPLWAAIETTVEVHSSGESRDSGRDHAGSYALAHLEARPDRNAVLALFMNQKGLSFLFASTDGVTTSPVIAWHSDELLDLIVLFIYRLYRPSPSMVDDTIARNIGGSICTWNITLATSSTHTTFENYVLDNTTSPVGRRTNVFANKETPAVVDGKKVRVIKDQYVRNSLRLKESDILNNIMAKEPGVRESGIVHLIHHEELNGRVKRRVALKESGVGFMKAPTPRIALTLIYDLLETTRQLYREHSVLHRDISKNSVLFTNMDCAETSAENPSVVPSGPVFLRQITKSKQADLDTDLLAIDFDCGEVKSNEQKVVRTGTPIFISRAVHLCGPLSRPRFLDCEGMPQAPQPYAIAHPDRVQEFPESGPVAEYTEDGQTTQWRHELRHDAESIYLLLVYWALLIKPRDDPDPESLVPAPAWVSLGAEDNVYREALFALPNDALHPSFRPLIELITPLGALLKPEYYWARSSVLQKPEYVHEALQRHIAAFMIKHQDASFLDIEIDTEIYRANQKAIVHYERVVRTPSAVTSTEISRCS